MQEDLSAFDFRWTSSVRALSCNNPSEFSDSIQMWPNQSFSSVIQILWLNPSAD